MSNQSRTSPKKISPQNDARKMCQYRFNREFLDRVAQREVQRMQRQRRLYICTCMCVCMYLVSTRACVRACIYVMCACGMHACTYVMHICAPICMYANMETTQQNIYIYIYICIYIYIYRYACVCVRTVHALKRRRFGVAPAAIMYVCDCRARYVSRSRSCFFTRTHINK